MINNTNIKHCIKCRTVIKSDIKAILNIYSFYVNDSISTFEESLPSEKIMESRISSVLKDDLPWIVLYIQLKDPTIIGYAYAKQFHHRSAYNHSVEWSVYLDKSFIGQGVASIAFDEIKKHCIDVNKKTIVAIISCLTENQSYKKSCQKIALFSRQSQRSLLFHKKVGFMTSGRLKSIGTKFGLCLDTVYMQYCLS